MDVKQAAEWLALTLGRRLGWRHKLLYSKHVGRLWSCESGGRAWAPGELEGVLSGCLVQSCLLLKGNSITWKNATQSNIGEVR